MTRVSTPLGAVLKCKTNLVWVLWIWFIMITKKREKEQWHLYLDSTAAKSKKCCFQVCTGNKSENCVQECHLWTPPGRVTAHRRHPAAELTHYVRPRMLHSRTNRCSIIVIWHRAMLKLNHNCPCPWRVTCWSNFLLRPFPDSHSPFNPGGAY